MKSRRVSDYKMKLSICDFSLPRLKKVGGGHLGEREGERHRDREREIEREREREAEAERECERRTERETEISSSSTCYRAGWPGDQIRGVRVR